MKPFLFVLLLISVLTDAKRYKCNNRLSCGCGSSNVEINSRIIHGEQAIRCSWPMIVSIRYDFIHKNLSMHTCGGTILTDSYILTAASCLEVISDDIKFANISIAAGMHSRSESDQIIREVDQIIIHQNWTRTQNGYHHDIALVHLSQPLNFRMNSCITRTCLPSQLNTLKELLQYPLPDETLVVAGWGHTIYSENHSDILQQAMVFSIGHNDPKCNNSVSDLKGQFCAGMPYTNTGSCHVDIGSPIFHWIEDHWEQVGITSLRPGSCRKNSAIVYTRTACYRDWIEEHIKTNDKITEEISFTITLPPIDITDVPSTTYLCDKYVVPCGCGRRSVQFPQTNILVATEAIPYSWSMIVSIRLNSTNKHACSGSILSQSYILTSASCIANVPSFGINIVAGIHNYSEDDATYRKVDQIFLHPDYIGISNNYANDIAILHISQSLDFDINPFISRICLPEKFESIENPMNYPQPGTRLALIGWGSMSCQNKTNHDLLQQIQIYSMNHADKSCFVLEKHRNTQFCAGIEEDGIVPCVGDPGSPIFEWLTDRWQQVGVASHIIDCVPFRYSGIYTRIIEYNDWIQSIISNCSITSSSTSTLTTVITTTTTAKSSVSYQCNTTSTCGCGSTPVSLTPSRIVGGENALESSWPMIVSMRWILDDYHRCGGTILSNSYILTAAHCLHGFVSNPPIGVTIAVGMTNISDSKQIRRTVDHIYIHPNYIGRQDNYRHDIALMHINQSLMIDHNRILTKTCIHRVNPPMLNNQYIKNGTRLTVIGWGETKQNHFQSPTILQQAEVYAIDNENSICRAAMNDSEIQFCTGLPEGGKDSCQGDSGGPIFQWTGQYWEQVGIVSHGNGCAQPGYPGVYTRLSFYYDWINDILKNDNEHLEPQFSSYETSTKPDTTTTINEATPHTKSYAHNHQEKVLTFAIIVCFLQYYFMINTL
ncbi:unnamed protein product [Rotaria sp. Silwood2]|nr:unnamed protein product [Rotaria sp. Silwood2]CAF3890674.1 unnamed protein product [Rotaria sp. Silwood2]